VSADLEVLKKTFEKHNNYRGKNDCPWKCKVWYELS